VNTRTLLSLVSCLLTPISSHADNFERAKPIQIEALISGNTSKLRRLSRNESQSERLAADITIVFSQRLHGEMELTIPRESAKALTIAINKGVTAHLATGDTDLMKKNLNFALKRLKMIDQNQNGVIDRQEVTQFFISICPLYPFC